MVSGTLNIFFKVSRLFSECYIKINSTVPCTVYKKMGYFQSQRWFATIYPIYLFNYMLIFLFPQMRPTWSAWERPKKKKREKRKPWSACAYATRKPLSILRSSRKFVNFEKDSWPHFLFLFIFFPTSPKWYKRQCILIW